MNECLNSLVGFFYHNSKTRKEKKRKGGLFSENSDRKGHKKEKFQEKFPRIV
jgi:hypothetical protein